MYLIIPPDYCWVILSNFFLSFVVLQILSSIVMKARKKYDVKYPLLYDADKPEFNCIQRGHQNALETFPSYLIFSAIGGLIFPRTVAFGGVCWALGRYLYMKGYQQGPEKRYKTGGAILYIGLLSSLICMLIYAFRLFRTIE